jgi:hypothetical protein
MGEEDKYTRGERQLAKTTKFQIRTSHNMKGPSSSRQSEGRCVCIENERGDGQPERVRGAASP